MRIGRVTPFSVGARRTVPRPRNKQAKLQQGNKATGCLTMMCLIDLFLVQKSLFAVMGARLNVLE